MNYFQELLESYEKIKQRKFAVRIDERGEFQELEKKDPERAEAIENKLSQEFDGYKPGKPSENSTIGIGSLTTVNVPEGETAGTMTLPAVNQAYSVTLKDGGTAVFYRREGSNTNAQIISDQGKVNTKELSGYKNALANSKGEIPTLDGTVDSAKVNAGSLLGTLATPQLKTSFQGLIDIIREAAGASTAEGEAWTEEPASYVTGNRLQSLERKLSRLELVKLSPITGKLEKVDLDPAVKSNMIEQSLQSMSNLYQIGLPNDSEAAKLKKCIAVSNSIRRGRGGKIVALTAEDATEGIRFTPSPADQYFMNQVEKVCGETIERTPGGIGGYDQHSINDFVGKMSEMASVVLMGLDVIKTLPPNKQSVMFNYLADLTRREILDDVDKFRQAFGPWLQKVKSGATDAEGAAIEALAKQVDTLVGGTEEEVMSFFKRLSLLQAPMIQKMKADIMVQTGKLKGQGYKADMSFVYRGPNAKARAEEAAKELGIKLNDKHKKRLGDVLGPAASRDFWTKLYNLSEKDLDEEVYALGDGLKTKAHRFTEMTMGETDSTLDMIAGNATEIAPGYYDVVKKRLGFSNADVTSVREYNTNLISLAQSIDGVFPQGGLEEFDPITGNTTLSTGKTQLDAVRELLAKDKTFDEIEHGQLLRVFKDKSGNDLNLSDPVNMAKANEGIKRYMTAMRVSTDANTRDDQGNLTPEAVQARKWLAYNNTLVGGEEAGVASTVQDLASMETMTFPHNQAIDESSKGIINDTWDVKMPDARTDKGHPGATLQVVNQKDEKDRLLWRQTRSWNGAKAVTRGGLYLPRHAVVKRAKIDEKLEGPELDTAETMLFNYLNNQQKILEGLVSLIKAN